MKNILRSLATVLILIAWQQPTLAAGKLKVFVSIVPQKYFVEQIGGDRIDVQVMVKPGASPHTYEPKPRQMAALSKTRIYFAVGVSFEKVWLRRIAATNPRMAIVRTDQEIDKISMATHLHEEKGDKDLHQEDEEHGEHRTLDPHIWLSPPLVKLQAKQILIALQKAAPSHGQEFENNYRRFITEIDRFDEQLRDILKGKKGLPFMVFHPSWGYFADAYGLKQIPIEIEGKSPKPAQLKELIEYSRKEGIKVIFVQPQFSSKSAKLIAGEIGGQLVFADPLAADWMANLKMIAAKFERSLE